MQACSMQPEHVAVRFSNARIMHAMRYGNKLNKENYSHSRYIAIFGHLADLEARRVWPTAAYWAAGFIEWYVSSIWQLLDFWPQVLWYWPTQGKSVLES